MECLLIFDHLNDIIYSKYNQKFAEHINKFAALEGLHNNTESENRSIHNDIIIQVFSPIITSQRIMNCQFGNSYTSIQCEDGLNLCFDEYMGYLFVSIGESDVSEIKHFLRISVTIVRYLCGPDVCQLKNNVSTAELLTTLMDTWLGIKENDQAMLVEAIEPLCVNSDIANTTKQALQKSINKLTASVLEHKKMHGIMLVENKFLAMSSSPNTKELSVSDILFSIILSSSVSNKQKNFENEGKGLCSEENDDMKIHSFQALLAGSEFKPGCLSHVIHIIQISKNINLLYLLEVGNAAVSSHLYETFCYLHAMQLVQIQKDVETLRPIFESMDTTVKRLCDALKKVKIPDIENSYKQLTKKWDVIRKKYLEFIKSNSDEALLRAETLILGFLENLKHLLALTSVDETVLLSTQECAMEAARMVGEQLEIYRDFLEVKAIKNLSLGSDSLTINKYLEEFPGLVHFIYIDRTSHRIIAPTLDFNSDDTNDLTKRKIWAMISFIRNHLQEGCLSLIWKDSVFSYSYFLWFEDPSGTSVKPVIFPTNSSKALPLPGLFGSIFYQKLKEICFPKSQPAKIRCFEIYCIHLGLVTASCVLEHSRRLAATVCELRGQPSSTIDLL